MQFRLSLISAFTVFTWLSGCTTVDGFRNMAPDVRAQRVCDRRIANQDYVQQARDLQDKLSDAQASLSRGYRVHRQCQQVQVYGDPSVTCSKLGNYTNCQQFTPSSSERRCTETPVSINPELEKSNIQQWSQSIASLKETGSQEWQSCYRVVIKMSPEEAYKWYRY
jgi:hypothetical protein